MERRDFLKYATLASAQSVFLGNNLLADFKKPKYQISLAEWSLHNAIFSKKLDHLDFPAKTKSFGIDIVEYVNTCFFSKTKTFKENAKDFNYLQQLLDRCNDNGVTSHLIMCDAEGDLGAADEKARAQTVDNHYKWVDAAKFLGCKSIRVNAGGKGTAQEVAKNAADGLARLSEFAAKVNINVIVENHGSYSSNGEWLSGVIKSVNMPNCGTLPDFGNFCITRKDYNSCEESYDRYKGVAELMPFAKGVSAKTNDFLPNGNEAVMDYKKLFKIVKKANFNGIIGIEYEGKALGEDEGIIATKKLIQKYI